MPWVRDADVLLVDGGDATYLCHWMRHPGLAELLGLVDFSIFPHLDAFPENTMRDAERWAAEIGGPACAIDEQTALKVVHGRTEVVSEGRCPQVRLGRSVSRWCRRLRSGDGGRRLGEDA